MDDNIRRLAGVEPIRPAGDRIPGRLPTNPEIGRTSLGGRAAPEPGRVHANAVAIKTAGAAGLDHGNDFNGHPQLRAEHRAWRDSMAEKIGVSGIIQIDPNIANVWYVTLAGAATLQLVTPEPIPQDQLDAGRGRSRAILVQVYIERNGHALGIAGVTFASEGAMPASWKPEETINSIGFSYVDGSARKAWFAHATGQFKAA